jgi:Gas vesicle protein G
MDPVTLLFRLPFLPITGLIRLAEIIDEEAQRELQSPLALRRALEDIEEAQQSGQASEEEVAEAERDAVSRLTGQQRRAR